MRQFFHVRVLSTVSNDEGPLIWSLAKNLLIHVYLLPISIIIYAIHIFTSGWPVTLNVVVRRG